MWKLVRKFVALSMICFSLIGCLVIWITDDPTPGKGYHSKDYISRLLAQRPLLTSKCTRQLQLWTNAQIYGYSNEPFRFQCPGVPCEASIVANTNLSTTKLSDGVVFFSDAEWGWDKMHSARPHGQKWFFYSRESPTRTRPGVMPPMEYNSDSYDYTMTYRHDSDFPAGFGYYNETKHEIEADDDQNWAAEKTNILIAPAADCQPATWKRDSFIKELKEFVPVDLYGECTDPEYRPCEESVGCLEKLRFYKFSLALENSRCRDFITEKFFMSLASGTVPIVDGPRREDYERVGPPNSFIHVSDFGSVQELADYIKLVDSNDKLYNRFFDWKKRGNVVTVSVADLFGTKNICPIFQRMYDDEMKGASIDSAIKPKISDWEEWWQGSCSY
nr:4-galactosyl-N-acetylglucosaminide 3-alpha-L-fucosyltransferase 9-like [Lytechinus pictus]